MALEVKITTGAWYGDKERILTFPDSWDVSVYESRDVAALDEPGIQKAFAEPIGTERIADLARGRKSAVIIVDDLSRPTPAHLVIPNIIDELERGGIKEESIVFVMGGGSHRPLTAEELAQKIGQAAASKYRTYNHNVFGKTLENLGELADGTPVHINEIVMSSDLKIGVGGIIPHASAGFGGGGKIIVPGVASYDTIAHNHGKHKGRERGSIEKQVEGKDKRENAEDVARHIGLDVIVNMALTHRREIAGLFVGDVMEAHHKGKLFAKDIYNTIIPNEDIEATDIVVINSYPQDATTQIGKSMWPSGVFKNAQRVMINSASDGIRYHGMGDKVDYDTFLKMKAYEPEPVNVPEKAEIRAKEDFVLLSANFPKGEFYKRYSNGVMFENWENLVHQLKQLYDNAKVALIPYSPIQLPHIV
jgi:nickel-dependent lactate racemase